LVVEMEEHLQLEVAAVQAAVGAAAVAPAVQVHLVKEIMVEQLMDMSAVAAAEQAQQAVKRQVQIDP
jgi:hypothetical protein